MDKIWIKNYDEGVLETINIDQYRNVNEMLNEIYNRYGSLTAFSNFNSTISYKEVQEYSLQFSGYLQSKLNIKKGDRVALLMPNTLQTPIINFAALQIGAIVMNIPLYLNADQIKQVIKETEPQVLIVLDALLPNLLPVVSSANIDHVIVTRIEDLFGFFKRLLFRFVQNVKNKFSSLEVPKGIRFRDTLKRGYANKLMKVDIDSNDSAFIQFTGARGQAMPKCIEITHKNVISNILQISTWFDASFKEDDVKVVLQLSPLYRAGVYVSLQSMYHGCYIILITDPTNLKEIASRNKTFSIIAGIQFIFELCLKNEEFTSLDFSKIKICSGAGGISNTLAAQWKALTNKMILQMYTLTESSCVICINPVSTKFYHDTAGLPLPSIEVKICDNNGVEQSINQKGELWIKGPQVMKGYWRNPELTEKVLTKDGWLKTGDIVTINQDGYITILERVEDLIQGNTDLFSPLEVEGLINTIDGVLESAVVQSEAKITKGKIIAYVVKDSEALTNEEILKVCRKNLLEYKVPDKIVFMNELPKSYIGYVLRRKLRELE